MNNAFVDELANLEQLSLRLRPKPEVQIAIGTRLTAAFVDLSRDERIAATNRIAKAELWKKILALSGYLAETAVNMDDPKLLKCALLLHVIEGFTYDYRENFRRLVLITYAARDTGADFSSLVGKIAGLGTDTAGKYLRQFAARDPDYNQLSSFDIRADRSTGMLRFVPA